MDLDDRIAQARAATAPKRPVQESDIHHVLDLIGEQIDDYSSPQPQPNTVTHAYRERWQRALMTVVELWECWERDQEDNAETAHERTWQSWVN